MKQVLLTTCKDRISKLLDQMSKNQGETIILSTAEKAGLGSARGDKNHLENSALKPKKLTFVPGSPSRQFSLLGSDCKQEPEEIGRFSLALHACMTPREEASIVIESENEGDEDVEESKDE